MKFGIEKKVLLIRKSGIRQIPEGKTSKSRINQNSWRERKLQILGNI